MLIGIIVTLIIGLVVIAVAANVLQQQKEKRDSEQRKEMAKHRTIIEETEDIIVNDIKIPISPFGFQVLYRRVLNTLKAMNQITPNHKDILARINDVTSKLEANEFTSVDLDNVKIPDNEKVLVTMIQALKKYRMILRSEHNKGGVASQTYTEEDKRIERLQLRINITSQVRRGKMAKKNNMTGSARQYFEKAMVTLDGQVYTDDYIMNAKVEIQKYLDDITKELNADQAAKKAEFAEEQEQDNLDALFAPKKKW